LLVKANFIFTKKTSSFKKRVGYQM